MTKVCTKCKIELNISCFGRDMYSKDRHTSACKSCRYATSKAWLNANRDRNNKTQMENYRRKRSIYLAEHPPKEKKSLEERKQRANELRKQNRIRNHEEYKRQNREYIKRKRADPLFAVKCNLSSRLAHLVSREDASKRNKTLIYVGCLLPELKQYLSTMFVEGMSWDNYGEWHIDHYVPCAFFDHSIEDEVEICWNWRNLRPLWDFDNQSKNGKLPTDYEEHIRYIQYWLKIQHKEAECNSN